MEEFKNNPTYKNREILIALASEHDMNETSGYGLVRITEYEVGLINYLYLVSKAYQINSVKRKCEKSPDLDEENYAIK